MDVHAAAVALAGLLGLAIGSFLNVVIHRVPRRESLLFPSSRCPGCGTPIKARHNVPVAGWLVLRGRCASCRDPISPRYPLVELGTGLLFAAVTARLGLSLYLPAYLFLAAVGVALAMIDLDGHVLPNSIVLPSFAVGAALLMPAGAIDRSWVHALWALGGMATLAGIYLALVLAARRRPVSGEARLAALVGFYLGWLSWQVLLLACAGALALGVLAVPALARSRGHANGAWLGMVVLAAGCVALLAPLPLAPA